MTQLSGKFAMLPLEAITDHRLALIELRVLAALYSFKGSIADTEVFPSRTTLAERSGYVEGTVSRAVKRLRSLGWVSTKQHRGPNTYVLRCPETVTDPDTVTDPAAVTELDTVTVSDINSDRSGRETVADPVTPEETKKRHKEQKVKVEGWQPPDGLDQRAWDEFEAYRNQPSMKKKPWTDMARTKNAAILVKYPEDVQQQMVDRAIAQSWTGIYPLNGRVAQQQEAQARRPSSRILGGEP